MSSAKGKGSSFWALERPPRKVWTIICACSQLGGSYNLCDWDFIGGVLSVASGTPPSFGSGSHVYFYSHVKVALPSHPRGLQPSISPCDFFQSLHPLEPPSAAG